MTFQDTRRLVLMVRISGEETAQTCAAMLSRLDKDERDGKPVLGYAALLASVKEQTHA